ncbi:MFS transporter [Psychrosphaera haliotis]|uniref:MFS transporter n=1 Tax=Psychrosphaera haliotis TaxID=555083 RepID=A0A6N8FBI0_9GAMM|nr:MFS transporter [Psychrosphaera haliotis]MUH72879.1 MFS transporter [Psychrosphaera haliotis]
MHSDKLNTLEKRTAVSLASVFAIRMLGLFMLMPIMAIYGQSLEGVSPLWIGLAIGAYGLTQAAFQIPMGWLSDKYGRRRIIVLGLVIFAIGSVIAGLAEDIVTVTIGRAIQGMGAIASAVLALAADVTREEQRPKVMAVIGMCIGLSFSVALVLGPMVAETFGLSGVFYLTAVLAIVGIVVVLTLVPNSVTKAKSGEITASSSQLFTMMCNRQLLRLDFGVLVLHLMMTSMFIAIPVLFSNSGFLVSDHWVAYLPILLLSFVFMVPMLIIAAKKGQEKQFFLVAIVMLIMASIGLAIQTDFTTIIAMLFVFFIGFNFLEASLPAHVSRISPAGQKGTAMGVYSSSQFLGAFFGGITGGYVAETFGFSYLFASNAALALLWFVFASGMVLPISSKRVSIPFEFSDTANAERLIEQICQCAGVIEATLVEDENRIYLKVDKQSYDQVSVDQLVTNFN